MKQKLSVGNYIKIGILVLLLITYLLLTNCEPSVSTDEPMASTITSSTYEDMFEKVWS